MSGVHDFLVRTIDGREQSLADYRGQVLLIVNTASQCGFTPQYEGLERLRQTYAPRGFEVLGFPCNQFGAQEPGTEPEIAQFCATRFGVRFPMFAKIDVKGARAHPLYRHLTATRPGLLGLRAIKWNFTKFLVGRDGLVIDRFAPSTKPQDLARAIERALDLPG